jgi:hypothetical protein
MMMARREVVFGLRGGDVAARFLLSGRSIAGLNGRARRSDNTHAGGRYACTRAWAVMIGMIGQPVFAGDCVNLGPFVLPVEGDVEMVEIAQGLQIIFNAGGRSPSVITFYFPQSLDTTAMQHTAVLANAMTLHYTSQVDEAVGSGGAETRLSGWLTSTPPLIVSCTAQAEYPNAEWCLPIIGQIRPKDDGCETGGN